MRARPLPKINASATKAARFPGNAGPRPTWLPIVVAFGIEFDASKPVVEEFTMLRSVPAALIALSLSTAAASAQLAPPQDEDAAPPVRLASAQPRGTLGAPANEDVRQRQIDPQFLPREVAYDGKEAPGTIVIDTPNHFLYLVEANGRAMRYGIGVGRPGFTWSGTHNISVKKEWPDWVPPKEMLARQPSLPHFMAGGPNNPLGARAMYLGSTLYRIHGSNEPWTIGHNVSSGCIRLRNADVIDLYSRVKVGTKVIVL
jgi:lipoprotein-anchoring transpeptidase ErfK/SrfK